MSLNNSHRPSSSTSTSTTTNSEQQHIINDESYNGENEDDFRDIHALTPPQPPPTNRRGAWDSASVRSSNLSNASDVTNNSIENFTTMSREFNALVLAGSSLGNEAYDGGNGNNNLDRIGEEEGEVEDSNPLAIVPDTNPLPSPRDGNSGRNQNGISLGTIMSSSDNNNNSTGNSNNNNSNSNNNNISREIMVHRVKKEEVETKIMAWQNAKVAKINNRFKRDDAIISGWENEQVQKASSWMKKVEL